MQNLETGKDKIKQICEILKNETLEPAKEQAQKIIQEAEEEAERIIAKAKVGAEEMMKEFKSAMAKEKELVVSSMKAASRQAVEALKQEIENTLFNRELTEWIEKEGSDPKIASQFINALVAAIEKDGVSADFSAYIASKISKEKVNALLAKDILAKLKEKSVVLGDFAGGVQIKLHDRNLTLDLSDTALKELLARYVRKDFRELIFKG